MGPRRQTLPARIAKTKSGRIAAAGVVVAVGIPTVLVATAGPPPLLPGTARIIVGTPKWGNVVEVHLTNPSSHPQQVGLEFGSKTSGGNYSPYSPVVVGGDVATTVVTDPLEFGFKMISLGTLAPHQTVTLEITHPDDTYDICYGGVVIPEVNGKTAGSINFNGHACD